MYSQPAKPPVPLWMSYLVSYALTRSEEGCEQIRQSVSDEYRYAFDLCMQVQKDRGEGERSSRVDERTRIELEIRESRRAADAYEMRNNRKPVRCSLTDELALPDDDEVYAIDRLLPIGGNALFAGRYKAGKTTFNANLLRAWADDEPFLGHFRCHPQEDRPVATIFNYEMTRGQFRRWMRRFNIRNQYKINAVHLRGVSLPLGLPEVREEVAGWLRDANTGLWVIDPASRAMAGMGDSNSNTDVSAFTMWIDEIKEDAGVRDLVMNIHMPHTNKEQPVERAIGAQAWSAWGDALWMLSMDESNGRWFHAFGRDVDTDKMLVNYDTESMNVQLINTDPESMKRDRIDQSIIKAIGLNPGLNKRSLRLQLEGLHLKARHGDIDMAVEKLTRQGEIVVRPGPNRQVLHFLRSENPTLDD